MIQSKLAAFLLATATLGAGSVVLTPSTAHAQADVEVSFEFFNESLSPYGEWIEVGDYGLCWRPTAVDADWSPYTDGYWSYTDAGWTWVSYEDFGAITYHYGRWTNVEDEGWCWVPDYEWGPAWVSWRNNADYVGWAPLPPEARWEPSVGFSVWVDNSYDIGPSYYNFCAVEDFGAPVIREVILPRPRNVVIIQNTVNITNITVNRSIGIPFCGGPRYDFFLGRVRRPIPALKLVRETNVNNFYNNTVINKNVVKNTVINNKTVIKNGGGRGRALHAVQQGNQLIVPAPRVKRVANPLVAAPDIKPAKSVPASKVRKGWQLVQNAEQREQIKQKMARDAKGLRPETAPARAVETAELQPVPTKADPNAPSPLVTGGRGKRNGKNGNDRDRDAVAGVAAGEPAPQAPDVDNDRPEKPGREKNRNERKENGAGIAAGEPSPMKPFNGDDGQDGPGRGKNRDRKKEKGEMAGADETPAADEGGRQEKLRKEREQVARAAELQEEFRKRQKEQAQAARQEKQQMNDNAGAAEEKAARRAERKREAAQAAAADIRREQQSRAAEREAAREQASKAERQAERQREAQAAAMARRQQQDGQERRQQMQAEAAQQRRQQAAAAAAEARREQMKSMQRQQMEAQQQQRGQAMRQQQMQMQRQLQRQQQQQQFQAPQQQQQFRQGGGHGGGGGRGEGRGRRGEKGEKDN